MSVTGHNPVRHADDFYATPAWCTRAILSHLPESHTILDPCCGDGAILDVLAAERPNAQRLGIEIDDGRTETNKVKGHIVACADALGPSRWAGGAVDLILTNPPFGLAMEFVQRACDEVFHGGTVAMLLRLPWLASQKRAPWLRENTPSVYVLPKRPSFTGKGTDATDYAWMVWSPRPSTVRILDVAR